MTFEQVTRSIDRKDFVILQHAEDRSRERGIKLFPLTRAVKTSTMSVLHQISDTYQERIVTSIVVNNIAYGLVWGLVGSTVALITVYFYKPGAKYQYNPQDDWYSIGSKSGDAA